MTVSSKAWDLHVQQEKNVKKYINKYIFEELTSKIAHHVETNATEISKIEQTKASFAEVYIVC